MGNFLERIIGKIKSIIGLGLPERQSHLVYYSIEVQVNPQILDYYQPFRELARRARAVCLSVCLSALLNCTRMC